MKALVVGAGIGGLSAALALGKAVDWVKPDTPAGMLGYESDRAP